MHNFFVTKESYQNGGYVITGADHNHIKNVLRMKEGQNLLISMGDKSDLCEITEITADEIITEIIEENYKNTNLPIDIYLFQGLPKSDKMELIIQKCVELGVHKIIPVEMNRCVVKLDDKKKKSKISRWQAISESAAKQSKRNSIPEILDVMPYKKALEFARTLDLILVPYECKEGMIATKNALKEIKSGMSVGIFIGAEGGFDETEIELANDLGAKIISLGKRILRTETAAITAVSMCMLYAEMELEK